MSLSKQTLVVLLIGITTLAHAEIPSYSPEELNTMDREMRETAVTITEWSNNSDKGVSSAHGSGNFIDLDGATSECVQYVLTAHHNTEDAHNQVEDTMQGGIEVHWQNFDDEGVRTTTSFEYATVVHADSRYDFTILRLEKPICNTDVHPAHIVESVELIRTGQAVWMVSAVKGEEKKVLMQAANITSVRRFKLGYDIISVSAETQSGQSGGGLFLYDTTCKCFALFGVMQRADGKHNYSNYAAHTKYLLDFLAQAREKIKDAK